MDILEHVKTKLSTDNNENNSRDTSTSETVVTYRPPTTAAKLPEIVSEMTHAQFRKVETDWAVYKQLTKIPPTEIGPSLYSACDESVQTSLIDSTNDFFSLTEKLMLERLEEIVTRRVNTSVHRKNLS